MIGTKKGMRDAYGEILAELGASNENIVVLDADLSGSTKTSIFAKKFPKRFFNAGIAEQNMIGMAAGLSRTGKIVFASTFAMFATGRAWEQIRNSIAYPNLNVKICATHAGITVGEDGASHEMTEDIAIIRAIPNMVVISPSDYFETKSAIKWAVSYNGPVYVRMPRGNTEVIFENEEEAKFEFKKAKTLKEGTNLTIIATGELVSEALNASKILSENNVSAEVIAISTIKPIDREAIRNSKNFIVSVEDHSIIGGLGSAISEVISEEGLNKKLFRIGINDEFGKSGKAEELLKYYKLDSESIAKSILSKINP
ncbi:Transketolase central region [Methanococcus vannielii SB]|jgi:transketolase|uniref:Transketolase central region n=1 Tax=Methanococcus vannielii (strain ATCC 35089 / DSM 1224 / JCM 13029 / OCM 148 / SB) TaxID=406327 RepID=A6UPC3_METVS|nr:transketolase family protein [Methanococcus vannielii]ABR54345.1 Transketolase central region [Methanococcus vannielii SB]